MDMEIDSFHDLSFLCLISINDMDPSLFYPFIHEMDQILVQMIV